MNKCLAAAFVAVSLLLTPAIADAVVPDIDSTFDVHAEGWQHRVRGGGTDAVGAPTSVARVSAGEPGDADLFRLRVTGALDNGAQTLEGGNIQRQ